MKVERGSCVGGPEDPMREEGPVRRALSSANSMAEGEGAREGDEGGTASAEVVAPATATLITPLITCIDKTQDAHYMGNV